MESAEVAARYERAVKLLSANAAKLVKDGTPQRAWLDGGLIAWATGVDDDRRAHVLDVNSGVTRDATEAEAAKVPPPPAGRKSWQEADPPAAHVASPDGKWGVGLSEGNLQLHDLGDATARPRQLSRDGQPLDGYGIYYGNWKAGFVARSRTPLPHPPMGITWAPDSRRFIAPRIDLTGVEPYPFLETVRQDGSIRPKVHLAPFPLAGEEYPRVEWWVFDVQDGTKTRLDLPVDDLLFLHQDLTALRKITFSSDASHAYIVAHGQHMRSAHLYDVDLSSGAAREVVSESLHPRMDLNTSSYMAPNVFVIGDMDKVIWFSQRDGWGHLHLHDGTTGEHLHQITSGDWLVRDVVQIDTDRDRIFFTGAGREPGNPYLRRLYRIDLDGSNLTLLSPEDADCDATAGGDDILGRVGTGNVVSPDGKHVCYTSSTVTTPPVTVVRSSDDGALVSTIAEADVTELLAAGYVPPREFTSKAADGTTDLYGLLYLPADLDESASYPIMVVQYASPLMAACPRSYEGAVTGPPSLFNGAPLNQLGCAVMVVDARGTTGRSWEFAKHGYEALNIIGLDDYVAAIEQLGAQYDWLDTDRVGIIGGSYGGYTAVRAMIEFPETFRMAISDAPLAIPHAVYPDYHWYSFHGVPTYDGSELAPDGRAVPDNYRNVDAAAQVDRITGRMLVCVGELDENCHLSGVMPFVMAAHEADKDVDLLYVPNANHYTLGRMRYVIRRHLDYVMRHLVGVDVPDGVKLDSLEQLPEPAVRTRPVPW